MLRYCKLYLRDITANCMIREKSGLHSFDSEFWGGIENFKNLEKRHRKFTNNLNKGPVKI
jgi:hypothetical protein